MQNSHEWIKAIIERLFQPEDRRINMMIEELNNRNSAIKGKQLFGFRHLGDVYIPESCRQQVAALRKQQVLPSLAFELMNEASDVLVDVKKVNLDKDQIKQILFKLLYSATTLQDIRDALPECLVPLVPEIAKLSRYNDDPTWFIRNDHRALRQYEKILPKIELYAMTRMIY